VLRRKPVGPEDIQRPALPGGVTRGYPNGSGLASSRGDTDVNGYGVTARIGRTFNDVIANTWVTPFASYTYTSAHVGGYTEAGAPCPARWTALSLINRPHGSALTCDTRSRPANGYGVRRPGAHLVNGNRPTISGQSIGLFGTSAPGITGAPDWTELTEGSGLVATEDGLLLTQLSTSENLRD
jgi:hypothetical protein